MILLPALALLAFWLGLRRHGRGPLDAAVAALVVGGVLASLITELQSLVGALTPAGSASAWAIVAGLGLAAARLGPAPNRDGPPPEGGPGLVELAPAALLLALTLAVALLSAPNSYDGLTYHLVRVERWIGQGSLAPFATHDTRQLFMPSWAEYAILQLRLLSDGDRFANLVQWTGYAGACGGAALLARGLGGGSRAAAIAATLVASLPMAVAQASGTQVDDVAACWAVVTAAYGFRLLGAERRPGDALLSAMAFGLAAASKQTAVLFGGAALIPVLLLLAGRKQLRLAAGWTLAAGVAVALLAGPQLARTREVFGNFRGDPYWTGMVASTARGPGEVLGTAVRNLSLHFGTPWDGVNRIVAAGAAGIVRAAGADPDDQRTTWWSRFGATRWNTHEATAPDPLHLLLLAGCALALLGAKDRGPRLLFAAALAVSFVAFCAVFKWQPYNSRLHTPLFALGLALAGVVMERASRTVQRALLAVLALAALPNALLNYTRPLLALPGHPVTPTPSLLTIPRTQQYFLYWPALARPFLYAAVRIAESGCADVGIRDFPDAWEYPIMALTRQAGSEARFRSVDVFNPSARFAGTEARPCLLVQIGAEAGTPPSWAADWRPLMDAHPLVGMDGLALFAPPPPP